MAQLEVAPCWEARVQAPSKPEFFQASFSAISLIAVYLRGSIRHLSPAGQIRVISYIIGNVMWIIRHKRIPFLWSTNLCRHMSCLTLCTLRGPMSTYEVITREYIVLPDLHFEFWLDFLYCLVKTPEVFLMTKKINFN